MIVVTGPTGTVGSRLVEQLVQRGARVRVFCRDAAKGGTMFGGNVEIATGDFEDPDSIRAALTGARRVFLLSAAGAEPDGQATREGNVIAAAARSGVEHVVKLSVVGADEAAPIRYQRVHAAVERQLKESGIAHTILRPAGFMQNLVHWAAGGAIHTCAEDGRSPLIDARDIAAVAAAALTEAGHEGRTYRLTGPESVSYDEAAATLSEASGRDIEHVRVSPEELVQGLTGVGVPRWMADDLATQFGQYAAGESIEVSGDVAAVTGREARSLEDFARDEFAAST